MCLSLLIFSNPLPITHLFLYLSSDVDKDSDQILDCNRHWMRQHVYFNEVLCICDKNKNLISCPNYSTWQKLRLNIKIPVAMETELTSMSVLLSCTGMLITKC